MDRRYSTWLPALGAAMLALAYAALERKAPAPQPSPAGPLVEGAQHQGDGRVDRVDRRSSATDGRRAFESTGAEPSRGTEVSGPGDRARPQVRFEAAPLAAIEAAIEADTQARRWASRALHTGLCGEAPAEDMLARRARLLEAFRPGEATGCACFQDAGVEPSACALVSAQIAAAGADIEALLGDRPAPPDVYVYAALEDLRAGACVGSQAVAYYDGAIHVVAGALLAESVAHEYVHHALTARELRFPAWLNEGLAITVAHETWVDDPRLGLQDWLAKHHLPFASLVYASPHTADPAFAVASYYQSAMMVRAIVERSGAQGLALLLERLVRREVDPEGAFALGMGVPEGELDTVWARGAAASPAP